MKKPRGDGQAIALQEMMKQAGFTDEEFSFLKQAQANSDGLVGLEVRAMNAVKGDFQDKDGNYTVKGEPDFKLARTLVHSVDYHRFKAKIWPHWTNSTLPGKPERLCASRIPNAQHSYSVGSSWRQLRLF